MKRLFLVLILMLNTHLVLAEPAASESLARQLKRVHTFSSDFIQEVLSEKEVVVQRSTGKMQFDRSYHGHALFYWHVISPTMSTMYYRDNTLIFYDPDLSQATIKKVNYKDPSMFPLLLLTGDPSEVLSHFSVVLTSGQHYILKPKSTDKDELLLGVGLDLTPEGAVQKIQYQTTLGPRTQIMFNHESINKTLHEQALFFEKLPPDTDRVYAE